jgi:ABC-type protease/lipase transport system fused ATPase/permease subunit
MIYKYLSFSVSITLISFIVGMAVNAVLKKTKFYNHELSNLNFVRSDILNKWFGVGLVKWTVKNTPFKYLNQKLKLKSKIEKTDLHKLRQEMTSSEIDHLVGFVFVTIFALVKFYKTEWLFGLTIMIVNILMNLNPSLLQQQNKRRIDKLIKK